MSESAESIFRRLVCDRTLPTGDDVVAAVKEFARLTHAKFCKKRTLSSRRGVLKEVHFACSQAGRTRPNGEGTECPAFFRLKFSASSFVVKEPFDLQHNHPLASDMDGATQEYERLYEFFSRQTLHCFDDVFCAVRDYETLTSQRFRKLVQKTDTGEVRRVVYSCVYSGPPTSDRPFCSRCSAKFVFVLDGAGVFTFQARRTFLHNHQPHKGSVNSKTLKPCLIKNEETEGAVITSVEENLGGISVEHANRDNLVNVTEDFFKEVGRRRCPTMEEFERRLERFQEVNGTVLLRRFVRKSLGRIYWYCSRMGCTRRSSLQRPRVRAYKPRSTRRPRTDCPFRFISKQNADGSVVVAKHHLVHNHPVNPLEFQWYKYRRPKESDVSIHNYLRFPGAMSVEKREELSQPSSTTEHIQTYVVPDFSDLENRLTEEEIEMCAPLWNSACPSSIIREYIEDHFNKYLTSNEINNIRHMYKRKQCHAERVSSIEPQQRTVLASNMSREYPDYLKMSP